MAIDDNESFQKILILKEKKKTKNKKQKTKKQKKQNTQTLFGLNPKNTLPRYTPRCFDSLIPITQSQTKKGAQRKSFFFFTPPKKKT